MRRRSARIYLVRYLAVGCFIAASAQGGSWYGQSQSDQQPGPKPNVGETTIAPKKIEPAPATAPEAKKPERINPNDIYTLSTSTNLVNLDVMIKDNNGNPISGFGRKNFRVFDDGVQQTVSNFGTVEAPITLTMLIEFTSKQWQYLYLALEDAYQFLNFIQPKDWVAVVSFDMKPQMISDFTQDRSEVKGALDQLRIPGFAEVNLYDGLAWTIDRMKDVQGRKAILLVATGCDTFSKLNYDQFLKIVKASDTAIYPVSIMEMLAVRYGDNIPCGPGTGGFGSSMNAIMARNALTTIANDSGGQAYFPRFDAELPSAYEQVAGQLRTQYSLGFIPTNPAKDGRYHKLKVEVVDESGNPLRIPDKKGKPIKYRVVSREGYYAPKS